MRKIGTARFKDVNTNEAIDQVQDLSQEGIPPDPIGPDVNPAFGDLTPFAIATQHHAPPQLLAMQMGGAQMAAGSRHAELQTSAVGKYPWGEKAPWRDTRKEIIWDPTFKEIIHDPQTIWEQTFDHTQLGRGPLPGPWAGGGLQGFGM